MPIPPAVVVFRHGAARSQIPLADRRRKLAPDRHFQPAADRIQNHLLSGAA
jgi:hypothetical protein